MDPQDQLDLKEEQDLKVLEEKMVTLDHKVTL